MPGRTFPRLHCRARVRACTEVAPDVFELSVDRRLPEPFPVPPAPGRTPPDRERLLKKIPVPAPGQFFLLKAAVSGVFLGRPVSVFRCDASTVRFLLLRKGRGTAELCALRRGDEVELTGPSGNSFIAPGVLVSEKFLRAGKRRLSFAEDCRKAVSSASGLLASAEALRALLRERDGGFLRTAIIGGGIGIAPVAYFASTLPEKSFDLFACFRSAPFGVDGVAPRAARVFVTTEDGSAGTKGMLPDVFVPADYDAVYACGPEAMLRYVKAAAAGFPAEVFLSLERRMACGAGACLGCTVPAPSGNKRCCVDGPVFRAEEVLL